MNGDDPRVIEAVKVLKHDQRVKALYPVSSALTLLTNVDLVDPLRQPDVIVLKNDNKKLEQIIHRSFDIGTPEDPEQGWQPWEVVEKVMEIIEKAAL